MITIYTLMLFLRFCLEANSSIEDAIKEDLFYIFKKATRITQPKIHQHLDPNDVGYYLYSDKMTNVKLDPKNPKHIKRHSKVIFIVHGWTHSRAKPWIRELTSAFLFKDKTLQVIQVDWRVPANQIYLVSSWNTKPVGELIGNFIINLSKHHHVPPSEILIIGHSLGGHVAGHIGKTVRNKTGQKISRIVALDPSGHLFASKPKPERLNEDDAHVVQIIHTDGGNLGVQDSWGNQDFYPNGGMDQPGCMEVDMTDFSTIEETIYCDHHRAYEIYIEAVMNPDRFLSRKCDSWAKYQRGKCDREVTTVGDYDSRKMGQFFLETNYEKPFGRKKITASREIFKPIFSF